MSADATTPTYERSHHATFTLIQSASTLASAQRLVRGGRIAVDPNMSSSVSQDVWKCLRERKIRTRRNARSAETGALARNFLLPSELGETCHFILVPNHPPLSAERLYRCTRRVAYRPSRKPSQFHLDKEQTRTRKTISTDRQNLAPQVPRYGRRRRLVPHPHFLHVYSVSGAHASSG
jgi:hypothetical protein